MAAIENGRESAAWQTLFRRESVSVENEAVQDLAHVAGAGVVEAMLSLLLGSGKELQQRLQATRLRCLPLPSEKVDNLLVRSGKNVRSDVGKLEGLLFLSQIRPVN